MTSDSNHARSPSVNPWNVNKDSNILGTFGRWKSTQHNSPHESQMPCPLLQTVYSSSVPLSGKQRRQSKSHSNAKTENSQVSTDITYTEVKSFIYLLDKTFKRLKEAVEGGSMGGGGSGKEMEWIEKGCSSQGEKQLPKKQGKDAGVAGDIYLTRWNGNNPQWYSKYYQSLLLYVRISSCGWLLIFDFELEKIH